MQQHVPGCPRVQYNTYGDRQPRQAIALNIRFWAATSLRAYDCSCLVPSSKPTTTTPPDAPSRYCWGPVGDARIRQARKKNSRKEGARRGRRQPRHPHPGGAFLTGQLSNSQNNQRVLCARVHAFWLLEFHVYPSPIHRNGSVYSLSSARTTFCRCIDRRFRPRCRGRCRLWLTTIRAPTRSVAIVLQVR